LSNHGSSVIFKSTNVNLPAFYNTWALRAAYFANFSIAGPNNLPQNAAPNDFKQNYNFGQSLRDSKFSPNCGWALDAFDAATPADGGYPGMTSHYSASHGGSSNVRFSGISIAGFLAGWSIGTTGAQADTLLFTDCIASYCDTAVITCLSQSKAAYWMWGQMSNCRQGFDGVNYGTTAAGWPIVCYGTNFGYLNRVVNYTHAFGPLILDHCYFETVRSIGNFGTGSSTARKRATISGQQFLIDNASSLPPPILFDTYGTAAIRDLNFNAAGGTVAAPMRAWNFANDINTPVKLDSCNFANSVSGVPPLVGMNGTGPVVSLDNCLSEGVGTAQPMSDSSVMDVTSFTSSNRFTGTPRSERYSNGTGVVNYISPNVSGIINVAATSPSIDSRSVTFTASLLSTATSATLTGNWTDLTGWYMTTFSNSDVRPVLYTNGSTAAKWGIWPLSSAATSAASALGVTFTFTATDITLVQIGDMFCWFMTKQYTASTHRTVVAWIVTNIAGSVVTCQPMFDVTYYDTVANNFGGTNLNMVQPQWAPSGSQLTCSMNNSVNITAVLPVNTLKAGDWVKGAGIATNSRVVTTDGAGNITLNKATTGGVATGVVLSFGQFVTPTTSVAW
jgi:hypothetical protein